LGVSLDQSEDSVNIQAVARRFHNLLPARMEITFYNRYYEDSFLPSVFDFETKAYRV